MTKVVECDVFPWLPLATIDREFASQGAEVVDGVSEGAAG